MQFPFKILTTYRAIAITSGYLSLILLYKTNSSAFNPVYRIWTNPSKHSLSMYEV